ILFGVNYLYENDTVHRDLKPENILYRTRDSDSDIVIADFGMWGPPLLSLVTSSVVGCFGYVAPEVLNKTGREKAVENLSTDIIAYVLLCSCSPFRGDDIQEKIQETTRAKVEFHERYWSKVSGEGALLTGSISANTHLSDILAKTFIM
ncbi:kinase-like protein, partial [Rhizopogon vinicolor AM-OR11-026]